MQSNFSPEDIDALKKIAGEAIKTNDGIIQNLTRHLQEREGITDEQLVGSMRKNDFGGFGGGGSFATNMGMGVGSGMYETMTPNSFPGTITASSAYTPFTINRFGVAYAWMSQPVIQNMIGQPIVDAFSNGFKIKSTELSEEECQELADDFMAAKPSWEVPGDVEDLQRETVYQSQQDFSKSDLDVLMAVTTWRNLFGGAGLLIAAEDGPMSSPFRPKAVKGGTLQFIDCTRWELTMNNSVTFDPRVQTPYNYYGRPIHRSRVVRAMGLEAPPEIRQRLQSWGLSVLERTVRALNTYIRFQNLVLDLLEEAKIDVYQVSGYNAALMNPRGQAAIQSRMAMADSHKSYSHAVLLDALDKYTQKQLTFSGISELWDQVRKDLVCASGIPFSKLFGESGGGLNKGDTEMETYRTLVQQTRSQASPILRTMLDLRCIQKYGYVPKYKVEFPPLEVISGLALEEVLTYRQERIIQRYERGLLTDKEAEQELVAEGVTKSLSQVALGKRKAKPPEGAPGSEQGGFGAGPRRSSGGTFAKQSTATRADKKG